MEEQPGIIDKSLLDTRHWRAAGWVADVVFDSDHGVYRATLLPPGESLERQSMATHSGATALEAMGFAMEFVQSAFDCRVPRTLEELQTSI